MHRRILLALCLLGGVVWGQNAEADEALLTAARKGDLEGVKAALAKGAQVEAKTRHGVTPLFYAAGNGHEAVAAYLLEKGANANVSDTFYRMSALSRAVERGHEKTALLLLQKGATQGPTVVENAAQKGMTGVVQAVIDGKKATPDQLGVALAAAKREKKEGVAALLEKAGAKEPPKPDFKVEPEILASYAGTYTGDPIGSMQVSVKEGQLAINAQGEALDFGALDPETFQSLRMPQLKLKFTKEEGKVTGVNVMQGPMTMKMKKAVAAEAAK